MLKSPFVTFVADIVTIYFEKRISRSSAELSYFMTLTFFPLLICINSLFDLLHLNDGSALDLISALVPSDSLSVLTDYLDYISTRQSTALFIGGLILMITSSSAAFRALMNSSGDIYGQRLFSGLRSIVVSVLYSLLLLLAVYGSILLLVTGGWFIAFLREQLGLSYAFLSIWKWLRFVILFGLFCAMLFFYYRTPVVGRRQRPPVIWGTLFASVALVIVSIIFSWFIGMSSRYQLVYGSLASIFILMVWLYLCGNILILGSAVNFVYEKQWQVRHLGG